jgi:hypothetical protein
MGLNGGVNPETHLAVLQLRSQDRYQSAACVIRVGQFTSCRLLRCSLLRCSFDRYVAYRWVRTTDVEGPAPLRENRELVGL